MKPKILLDEKQQATNLTGYFVLLAASVTTSRCPREENMD